MKRFLILRRMSPATAIAALILMAGSPAWAAERSQPSELAAEIRDFVAANQNGIVRELAEAVSIPSVASDRDNIRRKAEWLRTRFERRGFEARLLETDGNPLVFAELDSGAATTVLLYCHYDGQPVDPARWDQESPWKPVMRTGRVEGGAPEVEGFLELDEFGRDWRLYARTAADDTSPIIGILAALDALRAAGRAPTVDLKVILDGEEEAGSPSLVPAIARYRELLESDLMLILDGPIHASNRPTVVFGARGIQTVQLTAFGPRFPLHSGHYGNWAPNPAQLLARLLASMKDDSGKVLIKSERPILIRTSGGTVPISPFIEALGFPALSLPIVNFDNNQHSPNENVRLGHFFEGIVSIAAALTM